MQRHPPAIVRFPYMRWSHALRALGLMIACVGGFVAYTFMQSLSIFALTIGLASICGALLWRAWRASLLVPAVLWLGAVMADALYRAPDHLLSGAEVVMALDLLVVAALPAAVGSAIGVSVGMWLERRLSQPGAVRRHAHPIV